MGIRIDPPHIKKLLETLQNMEFGAYSQRLPGFTKKEKSTITRTISLLNEIDPLKGNRWWLRLVYQIVKILGLVAIFISTIITTYYGTLCVQERLALEDNLARCRSELESVSPLTGRKFPEEKKAVLYKMRLDALKEIRKENWGFFGRIVDFFTRRLK